MAVKLTVIRLHLTLVLKPLLSENYCSLTPTFPPIHHNVGGILVDVPLDIFGLIRCVISVPRKECWNIETPSRITMVLYGPLMP